MTITAIVPGTNPGEAEMCEKCAKIANFGFYGFNYGNYGKTVEDRWVYAARRLTSIKFSFDPCNVYRNCPRRKPRGGQNVKKCAKMATFGFLRLELLGNG